MQKIRESLALLLLALLPLHALLVTVGTKLMVGPGHAPLTALALWKEGLLALILLIALTEIISRLTSHVSRPDLPDLLILSLLTLAFLQPFILPTPYSLQPTTFAHGFRYDFVPLLSFLILRRVPWSDHFKKKLPILLLGIGAVIATYGIISFFLPAAFFTWLGYSDLHSLYLPDGPIAAFQHIGSTGLRRIQSTMSGPNHLGLWLLIPWSILMGYLLSFVSHTKERSKEKITANQIPSERAFVGINHNGTTLDRIVGLLGNIGQHLYTPRGSRSPSSFMFVVLSVLLCIALLLTFSRAAWIGAAIITLITLLRIVPQSMYGRVFIPLSLIVITGITLLTVLAPSVMLRIASSRDHFLRPLEAVRTMIDHPLGLGLGAAGPASNRTSDACVFLEVGSDSSWAADRPDLCVFVGNQQMQPLDYECICPFLPENWYLQIGVELGWIGFLLFLLLTLTILYRAYKKMQSGIRHHADADHWSLVIGHWSFLSFLALSLAALFLHAWEDMAVAVTVWTAVAIALPSGTLRPWNARSIPAASPSSTLADNTHT